MSPLGRTQDTAAIVARHVPGLGPAHLEPRLAEVTTGAWDSLTHPEIEAGWPGALNGASPVNWYFRAPGGESVAAALGRVRAWLGELDGRVVAVSHGLLGRLVRGAWLRLPHREALHLPVPQDVVWHLSASGVRPLVASPGAQGGADRIGRQGGSKPGRSNGWRRMARKTCWASCCAHRPGQGRRRSAWPPIARIRSKAGPNAGRA